MADLVAKIVAGLEVINWGGRNQEISGTKIPQRGQGEEPGEGLRTKPPETNDIF